MEYVLKTVRDIYILKGDQIREDDLLTSLSDIEKTVRIKSNGNLPVAARVEEYVTFVTCGADLSQSVTFTLLDVTSHLGLKDDKQKTACRVAIKRMVDKGKIEPVGHKSGIYRVVNNEDKAINLSDKSDLAGELPMIFPLGIHDFIKPMPHTIYIIAGETDSGKSGYLLNFAKINSGSFNVHYHSSEMGKAEFLDRLQYFWADAGSVKTMKFYERSNDFSSAIKRNPHDIHIVDYLQMFDNFYLMAEKIDGIGRALGNGIAFIAIQKPKGREEGLGGERTKDLSRLYLALSPGKLRIVKAKNWRDPKFNPNGMQIEFKLVEGCRFMNTTPWRKV